MASSESAKAASRRFYRNNTAYYRNYYRKNRKAILEKCRTEHFRKKLARVGLTTAEYQRILKNQNGGCAVCGHKPNGRKLDLDHCHTTGRFRGLLCNPCNQALGLLKDDPTRIAGLWEYIIGVSR